jgi:hypothetical protein
MNRSRRIIRAGAVTNIPERKIRTKFVGKRKEIYKLEYPGVDGRGL